MSIIKKRVLIAAAAVMLGVISNYCFKGWFNIIPWSIAGLLAGYLSVCRRDAIISGIILGYLLFLVYIMIGYNGKGDSKSILTFVVFDILFSIIGAVAGVVGALAGNFIKGKVKSGSPID